jgi:creatinine amidohydrolase/Fe(II)-dependent formamide hydrolase-like protein
MLMIDMTWKEVEKYISEVNDNLIIPVGTCEQHGYHLPLGNDIFCTIFFPILNLLTSNISIVYN